VNDKTHFATIKRRMVEEVSDHKISSKAREREREREEKERREGREGGRKRERDHEEQLATHPRTR